MHLLAICIFNMTVLDMPYIIINNLPLLENLPYLFLEINLLLNVHQLSWIQDFANVYVTHF
jgi:hypothetical protein